MPAKALSLLMATVLGIAPMCAEAQPVPGAWRHGPPGHWRGGPPRGPGRWGPPGRWHRPPPVWRPGYRYWGGDPWISNWQAYPGLYAPPYGYRWVRSGNQFLLAAIATGMISAVVAGAMVGPYR